MTRIKCITKESHDKVNARANELCIILDTDGNIVSKGTRRSCEVKIILENKIGKWFVAPLK